VRVAALSAPNGLASEAAKGWAGPIEPLTAQCVRGDDLVVDALFGAGLSRPLDGVAAVLAGTLPRERVVAVDVPSGLRDDGSFDGAVFKAALTVTFCRKKPGHVLYPGRGLCGDIALADIGVPEQAITEIGVKAWENQPALWRNLFPWPTAESHKHNRGRVGVASGGATQTGAARLAARAAARTGAGWVSVLSPPSALLINAAHLTSILLAPFKTT
jgi:NAD(P)H-hydrate epimerase